MSAPEPDKLAKDSAKQIAPAPDTLLGTRFEKRYELTAILGSGHSGTTYKASDSILERTVAVKILHNHLLSSPDAVERFKRESIATSSLMHRGIAQVYANGIAADGRPYMVMDCLDGHTLAQIITKEGKLQLDRFYALFSQIIEALQFAHEKGIVHRDIKPGNIIVTADETGERAVIVDFGIAKLINQSNEQTATQTGLLLGSSSYMSPEQCTASAVDATTDIYSLGCTMFESLAGHPPFQGESSLDVMYKHMHESLSKLKFLHEIPSTLAKMLRKCLQKKTAARYQSMTELRSDFQKCTEFESEKRPLTFPQAKKYASHPAVVLILAASLLGSTAVLANLFLLKKPVTFADLRDTKKNELSDSQKEPEPLHQQWSRVRAVVEGYQKEHKPKQSVDYLTRWYEKYGNNEDINRNERMTALATLCMQLLDIRDYDKVTKYLNAYEPSAQTLKEKAFVTRFRAEIFRSSKQPDKALSLTESFLKQYGDTLVRIEALDYVSLLTLEIDLYMTQKNYLKAAESYEKAIEVIDTQLTWPVTLSNPLRAQAIVAYTEIGNKAKADELLRKSLSATDSKTPPLVLEEKAKRHEIFRHIAGVSPEPTKKEQDHSDLSTMQPPSLVYQTIANYFENWDDFKNYDRFQRQAIFEYKKAGLHDQATQSEIELARKYEYLGIFEDAAAILKTAAQSTKAGFLNELDLLCATSYCFRQLNKDAVAMQYAESARKLLERNVDQDSSILWKTPSDCYARVIYELQGNSLSNSNQRKQILSSLIQKCQNHKCLSLTALYFCMVDEQLKSGSLEDALKDVDKLIAFTVEIKDEENQQRALIKKGEILSGKLEFDKALKVYLEANKLENVVDWHKRDAEYYVATTYMLLGDSKNAIKHYRILDNMLINVDGKSLTSNDMAGRRKLAMLETAQGNYATAEQLLGKSLEIAHTGKSPGFDRIEELASNTIFLVVLFKLEKKERLAATLLPGLRGLADTYKEKYSHASKLLLDDCNCLNSPKIQAAVRNQLHEQ